MGAECGRRANAEEDVDQDTRRGRLAPARNARGGAHLVHEHAHPLVTGPAKPEPLCSLAEQAVDLSDRSFFVVEPNEYLE